MCSISNCLYAKLLFMKYDYIIIGAGIAGISTAYHLQQKNFKVLLLEKDLICSGGSNAAGAFLSPKLSKPSHYKDYINTALTYSLKFYEDNFPDILKKCSLHKLPCDVKDWKKLESYEPYINFNYQKLKNHYILNHSGIIDPEKICLEMLKDIDYCEHYHVREITPHDNEYMIGDLHTKSVIITTPNQNFFDSSYIKTKDIAGYRYDVTYKGCDKKDFNTHKDLSISCFYDNKIAIGATFSKDNDTILEQAKADSDNLIKRAELIQELPDLKNIKTYTGLRNLTYDFFPIVGKLIDSTQTLKNFPSIKKGTKIPKENYSYYKNIYIHTALGSRGFVYAPYNAYLLTQLLTKDEPICDKLSTVRLFKKFAREG